MKDEGFVSNLVSIITPTYNSELYVSDAIKSVLSQTYTNWELIIIDDCSIDHSYDIAQKFSKNDSRIISIKSDVNVGPGEIRNIGIAKARGQYLAFLDSDDIWLCDKLDRHLKYIAEHDVAISYTSYLLMDDKGALLNKVAWVSESQILLKDYLCNTVIGCSTSIIDRFKVPDVRFKKMKSRVDTLLWISLLKQGYTAKGFNEVLAKYRIHNNSVSANKIKAAKKVWSLYREELSLPLPIAISYFSRYALNAVIKRFI